MRRPVAAALLIVLAATAAVGVQSGSSGSAGIALIGPSFGSTTIAPLQTWEGKKYLLGSPSTSLWFSPTDATIYTCTVTGTLGCPSISGSSGLKIGPDLSTLQNTTVLVSNTDGVLSTGSVTNSSYDLQISGYGYSTQMGTRNNGATSGVATVTYSSGGSISGTGTCSLSSFNGGGSEAAATVNVSSGSVTGVTLTVHGANYSSSPTTATLSSGTATCSGTATVSTTLLAASQCANCVSGGAELDSFQWACPATDTPPCSGSSPGVIGSSENTCTFGTSTCPIVGGSSLSLTAGTLYLWTIEVKCTVGATAGGCFVDSGLGSSGAHFRP